MIFFSKKDVANMRYDVKKKNFIILYEELKQCRKNIYLHCNNIHEIKKMMEEFLLQYPEFYYYVGCRFYVKNNCLNVMPQYSYSYDNIQKYNLKIVEETNSIISMLNKKNEYEKILFLHDYLCESIVYEASDCDCHSIIGSILKKKAVCDGISKAFKFLCDKLDLKCQIVTGKAKNGRSLKAENHSWNKIFFNGIWFNIDITFDLTSSIYGFVRHDYFLVSDIEIINTHIESMKQIVCFTNGIYYKNNNLVMDTPIKLLNFLRKELLNGTCFFEFQIPFGSNVRNVEKNIVKVVERSMLELRIIKKYSISFNKDRLVCLIYINK